MNSLIQNICRIEYTFINEVIEILTDNNAVEIDTTWHTLDIAPGGQLSIANGDTDSDVTFNASFAATLRSEYHHKAPVLLRFTLTEGEAFLIGGLDLPVTLRAVDSLQGKSINFEHTSWHYPYPVSDITGSSSSGSGL